MRPVTNIAEVIDLVMAPWFIVSAGIDTPLVVEQLRRAGPGKVISLRPGARVDFHFVGGLDWVPALLVVEQ